MIRRHANLILCLFFAVSALGLHLVKYHVQNIHETNRSIERELKKQKETIHLLRAEWVYLNEPLRVEALIEKHLLLSPVMPAQINDWEGLSVSREQDVQSVRY